MNWTPRSLVQLRSLPQRGRLHTCLVRQVTTKRLTWSGRIPTLRLHNDTFSASVTHRHGSTWRGSGVPAGTWTSGGSGAWSPNLSQCCAAAAHNRQKNTRTLGFMSTRLFETDSCAPAGFVAVRFGPAHRQLRLVSCTSLLTQLGFVQTEPSELLCCSEHVLYCQFSHCRILWFKHQTHHLFVWI